MKTQKSTPKGKEYWLIQLPPKFDIKSLQSLPLDATFNHGKKNRTYKITEDDSGLQKTVHIAKPTKDSNGSQIKVSSSKLKISKTLTISQVASIPQIDYDSVIQPKPVVEQKTGLQTKHWATGYYPTTSEPASDKTSTTTKKRHHHDGDESSPKKHKKHKKEKKHK